MSVDVILPLPLDGVFTYSVPPELERQVGVGHRVLVPFGRNKTYVGIVASIHGDCPLCEEEAQRPDYRGTVPAVLRRLTPDLPQGDHPRIGLSYQDALKYLRGEALVLPADTPKGIVTVTYKDIPLGPVKNIGNRANNLYPKPWRIKSTHLPTEPVEILSL